MKKNGETPHGRRVLDPPVVTAVDEVKHYCAAHPGSPSAVRQPQVFFRGDLWIALLGPTLEHGIVGIGPTIPAALRAFDAQYLARLRPPAERAKSANKPARAIHASASLLAVLFSTVMPC